jgi:hypothetical protein
MGVRKEGIDFFPCFPLRRASDCWALLSFKYYAGGFAENGFSGFRKMRRCC